MNIPILKSRGYTSVAEAAAYRASEGLDRAACRRSQAAFRRHVGLTPRTARQTSPGFIKAVVPGSPARPPDAAPARRDERGLPVPTFSATF